MAGLHIRPMAIVRRVWRPACFQACGLLGPVLLAWANRQSGPADLQPSGLRPTALGAGERALLCVARRGAFLQPSGSGHKTFSGLYSPWVRGRDSSHNGRLPLPHDRYSLKQSSPCSNGPEFTSCGMRILTFLPW
jgi:hypothetical protein